MTPVSRGDASAAATGLEVAIIGMAARFPGAPDLDRFWQNLRDGVESIRSFTNEELVAAGVDPELLRHPHYVRARPTLEDVEFFDAFFFGFSPREAELLDPQHRLFLECSWQALEDAGYAAERYGPAVGVYGGTCVNTYLSNLRASLSQNDSAGRLQTLLGNDKDYLATRVSYKLGLEGPSISVQTACSTSLVAVHLACQGLLGGECDLAIAGAVAVRTPQETGYLYAEGEIFSPDGHCRTFDAEARGTVFGSGVGTVVLKRLADALRDGDRVRAVIKGSAINNDGSLKVGYTAPRVETQARVIRAAQRAAEVDPGTIGYVEAHGTGTPLGDPIEVAALKKAFGAAGGRRGFCALGSVKTNLGHLETAAGIAGLIKTVFALQHRQIPPSLHFERPNPALELDGSPFYVNARLTEWVGDGTPRRAGVSSFGIGGTNAHVVLEEAPAPPPPAPSTRGAQLLLLSARTPAALAAASRNLGRHLAAQPEAPLADVAFSLHAGRRTFPCRQALVSRDAADAARALETLDPARLETSVQETAERPLAFLFPGQGVQYAGMTAGLYREEPVFREQVDLCAERLGPLLGLDLRTLLYPAPESAGGAGRRLQETAFTQPALFAVEYALAQLWMSWGCQPAAMLGHSLGEYVAACLAGVFPLAEALELVASRGRLMQELPSGTMLSVPLPEEEARRLLGRELSLAAVNGPGLCVVSGRDDAVAALAGELRARGLEGRRLASSHAFHSRMMDPILEVFSRQVRKVRLQEPRIPFVSNLTGEWIRPGEAVDPDYWVRHLRRTVRFGDGLARLFADPSRILLEVGPGTALSVLARRHPGRLAQQVVLSSLPREQGGAEELPTLLTALGRLWLAGVPLDAERFYARERRRRVPLPTYPFERQRYWADAPAAAPPAGAAMVAPAPRPDDERSDIGDWFYLPSWTRAPWPVRPARPAGTGTAMVFLDDDGLGAALAARLAEEGWDLLTVSAGPGFARTAAGYDLRPHHPADYEEMLAELWAAGRVPARIIHLWAADAAPDGRTAVERSFFSLLHLAQALGRKPLSSAVEITVISRGVQDVTGEEELEPEKATLLGPCRIIPQENELVAVRSIDLPDRPEATGRDRERQIGRLLAEIEAQPAERVVAYRGIHRWFQTFEPVRLDAPAPGAAGVRPGATVLITGGLGGVGLTLARHLAATARARLVLLGRSPLPERERWPLWLASRDERDPIRRKLRAILDLEALGAEVLVVAADVGDPAAVRAAVEAARSRFGEIHGVIHAAGVPGGGLLQLRGRDQAERVLAPKLWGARALESAFADRPLDFLVLCSSTIAVTGGIGQVDYCAANNFLDAFAASYTRRYGTPALAVDWDRWREVGMAVDGELYPPPLPAPPPAVRPGSHPLLGHLVQDTPELRIYETHLDADRDWILSEHRILGTPVAPGTALLEMARAAVEDLTGDPRIELRGVAFLSPLVVRPGSAAEVQIHLRRDGDGLEFRILGRPAGRGSSWREHAVGSARRRPAATPGRRSIAELASRCALREVEPGGEEAHRLVDWGPRWNTLRRVGWRDGEGLALLELPRELAGDLQLFSLHPALLDVATSFARNAAAPGSYLPFAYESIRVCAPLPRRIYSHALLREESGEALRFDVTILDEDGVVLVEAEGFTLRKLDEAHPRRETPATGEVPPTHGGRGIGSAQACEVFDRLMGRDLSTRVVVSTRDLQTVLARKERAPGSPAPLAESGSLHPRPALQTAYAPPMTPEEQLLARLWRDLLGVDPIGIHDSFFELGGDSILGIQLFSRARQEGIELTSHQLFTHQTIAELARLAAAAGGGGSPEAADAADLGAGLDFPELRLGAEELDHLLTRFSGGADE
jgi:phthiocerol/phenolphthiocerol synthesis type-I polyketide synthase E